ncbi:MAG: hypothetical protein ABMA14_22300, partial [Hyphomonadaceae bacterium]
PMLSARPLKWQPPQGTSPEDTVPAMSDVNQKIYEQQQRDERERIWRETHPRVEEPSPTSSPPPEPASPAPVRASTGVAPRSPDDTLARDDPQLVQRYELSGDAETGPETITVAFPVLHAEGAPLTASEMVWQTPVQLGGERPFQIWRLSAPPPFGWRAIAQADIDCQPFGPTPGERTVAMLSIALPAEGGASPNALALNISQLLTRDMAQSITYTHSTNRASGGSPVFDLETGKVFAVHVSSSPNLTGVRKGLRTGEGYSFRHLLDIARSSIDDAELGPVCGG